MAEQYNQQQLAYLQQYKAVSQHQLRQVSQHQVPQVALAEAALEGLAYWRWQSMGYFLSWGFLPF